MKKKLLPVLAAVVLIAILAAIGIIGKMVDKYIPTEERMDSAEYYGITEEGQAPVILQDELAPEMSMIVDGMAYLNYRTVKDNLNSRFYWDAEEELLFYSTAEEVFKIPAGSAEYTVSDEKASFGAIVVRTDGENAYIAADFVKQYTNMTYEILEEPARILIHNQWGSVNQSKMRRDESVRFQGGVKSPILTEAVKGDVVTVLEQMETWSKVVTKDGYIGYVRNKMMGEVKAAELTNEFTEPVYPSIKKDFKINLVWHQITSMDSNYAVSADIENMTGVNVISPTWFSVASKDGTISSLAESNYVSVAHEKGLEVWGLVDNFNQEVDIVEVLTTTAAREKLTDQLISAALEYELDGLNIDFESLPEEAGEGYLQFLRELSVQCRKNNLVLSTDNTVPREFSAHYQRDDQAEVVDYFIIMGYDEHYVGSEVGSVASLGFEKEGIELTISEGVPAEKIISAVPFYTRLWKTDPNGEITSEAIGMDEADSILEANGVTANWSEETSQDYAEYYDPDGNFMQIWLENEASIEAKAKLVKDYNLAGIAAWKLGLERSDIWEILSKYTN